ncbi:type IV pilus assembly PilZ [Anopheles sinensis]|uniref:Type IV pilus assembly PilZ n=1 Tax=Anopheles sinensis TaxID=74873 RepID=A0A084WPE9_ANOSI|nr:type IV pilus assembly PilZ [Anopheles sinensis]
MAMKHGDVSPSGAASMPASVSERQRCRHPMPGPICEAVKVSRKGTIWQLNVGTDARPAYPAPITMGEFRSRVLSHQQCSTCSVPTQYSEI